MLSVFYNFYLRILPERSEGVGEHERNENNVHVRVRANKQKTKRKFYEKFRLLLLFLIHKQLRVYLINALIATIGYIYIYILVL